MKERSNLLMEITEKVSTQNNIHFHMIPTKKFKTVNIVVKCKAPLNRKTITKRALLPYVLQKGTTNYPSEKQLMIKLDELYGAILSVDGVKKGNHHIISFRLEVANETYINNETTVIDEALQLLHDVVFDPYVNENAFPKKIVEREKITLKNKINSIYDDKLAYANMRLVDEMCKDELYRIHSYGYEEDLNDMDESELYMYYKQMLDEDQIDIYILGYFQVENMKQKVTNLFKRNEIRLNEEGAEKSNINITNPKEIIETQAVQQAKLHIGYRTNCTYQDDDYFALHVFNGLFGNFPSSKLFKNVREKHSLAYYASSRIESHKGLLIVFSGIEGKDYKKAKEIIELQMKAMQDGDFTNEEIEETKELIISEIRETLDSPQGIIELSYQQVIAQKEVPPHQFIKNIESVTKEAIVNVAKKVELDTIYLLTNEGNERTDG